jgi:hypothetical protein
MLTAACDVLGLSLGATRVSGPAWGRLAWATSAAPLPGTIANAPLPGRRPGAREPGQSGMIKRWVP